MNDKWDRTCFECGCKYFTISQYINLTEGLQLMSGSILQCVKCGLKLVHNPDTNDITIARYYKWDE